MSVDTEYYDLLGLKKEDNPDANAIRRAYKSMARKHHPDLNPGADINLFSKINEAYDVLKDEEKREVYDRYGKEGAPQMGGMGSFSDLFGFDFGGGGGPGRPKRRVKGDDVEQPLQVSLEDLYNGATRAIRVTRTRTCVSCKGVGATEESKVRTCTTCRGEGVVITIRQMGAGFVTQSRQACTACNGRGKSIDKGFACKVCMGRRVTTEQKELSVHIQKGMVHGQRITFYGEADEHPDYKPGDIIFQLVQSPHPTFKRQGIDLVMTKTIPLASALTGCDFTIEHLDKRIIRVKSAKGDVISPGKVMMIRGEGMPTLRDPFTKGNLLIQFEIEFPKKISEEVSLKLSQILPPKDAVDQSMDMEDAILEAPVYSSNKNTSNEIYEEDADGDDGQGRGVVCNPS